MRWLVRTLWQQKVKRDPVVVSLRIWETRGGTVVQNNPNRDSDVESWTESDGTPSSEQCEHNVESLALGVMGQDQSG